MKCTHYILPILFKPLLLLLTSSSSNLYPLQIHKPITTITRVIHRAIEKIGKKSSHYYDVFHTAEPMVLRISWLQPLQSSRFLATPSQSLSVLQAGSCPNVDLYPPSFEFLASITINRAGAARRCLIEIHVVFTACGQMPT